MKPKKESVFSRIADRSLRENVRLFVQIVKQTNFKKFTIIATAVLLVISLAGTLAVKFTQHPAPQLSDLTDVVVWTVELPVDLRENLGEDPVIATNGMNIQADVDESTFVAVVHFTGEREFCFGGTRDRVVVEQVLRGDTSLAGQTVYFYENAFIDYVKGDWMFRTCRTSLFREGEQYLIWGNRKEALDPAYWEASGLEELPEIAPSSVELSGFNLADTTSKLCLPDGQERRDLTKDTNEFNCVTQRELDNLYHIKDVILSEFGF